MASLMRLQEVVESRAPRGILILPPTGPADTRGFSVHLRRADLTYEAGYGPTVEAAFFDAVQKLTGLGPEPEGWEHLV